MNRRQFVTSAFGGTAALLASPDAKERVKSGGPNPGPNANLERRVRILRYRLDHLGLELGEERFVDYAYGERRVPAGSAFAITGFTYGERQDVSLFYKEVRLTKPVAPENLTGKERINLPAEVSLLERTLAGLKVVLDRTDKWIDYTKPYRGIPQRMPAGAPNVLTGVMKGHRNDDLAKYYGTLFVSKTPVPDTTPAVGNLERRVSAMENYFETLRIDSSGVEFAANWNSSSAEGGSDGARIADGAIVTAINWGRRLVARDLVLPRFLPRPR